MCSSYATSVFWPFGQPNHTSLKCWFIFNNSIPSPARPLLVIALNVSLFLSREVHARRSKSRCSPECRNSSKVQDFLLFTTHKLPPNYSLTDVIAGNVFSQAFGLHDGTDPTFRIAVVRALGYINRRAKVRWTKIKMALAGVHFVLAASGFLLLASGSSAAPMVCHFDSRGEARILIWPKQTRKHVIGLKSLFGFSTLCLQREELLTGWQLDGRLSAVYLSASRRRWLLRDVSTHTSWISVVWICIHIR